MAQEEGAAPGRFVQAMQSPHGVVTYRVVVGFLMALLLTIVTAYGTDQRESQREFRQDMKNTLSGVADLKVSVATINGRLDDQSERIGRNDVAIQNLSEKNGAIEHRVTVLESKRSYGP